MRVGSPHHAGSRPRTLLPLLLLVLLAVPAGARAQEPEPAAVAFTDSAPDVSSATSETFAFSAEGAEDFECALNDEPFAVCSSPHTVEGLGERSHTFKVRALDAGDALVAEGAVDWVVDLTEPDAAILTGPSGPVPVGPASFTFESTAADLDRLECQLDEKPWATCDSPLEVTVPAGPHVLRVRAVDAAGNVGPHVSRAWTAQAPAPEAPSLDGPPSPSASREATFTFAAAGAESYACTLDGIPLDGCTSPRKVTVDADGPHAFEVRGIAAGGTLGPVAALSWTVDTVKPSVTFAQAPARLTNAATATFVVESEPGSELSCRLLGPGRSEELAPCDATTSYTGLGSGDHTFEVQAVDAVGNSGSGSYAWQVDQVPPTVSIASAPPAVSTDLSAQLAFAAGEAGATFSCSLDGAAFVPCTSPYIVPDPELGDHAFAVRATDTAGNTSEPAGATWTTSFAAAFDWAPAAAVAGQPVTFTSRARGAAAALAWDLDDDGAFDDGTGQTAQRTFSEAGSYRIRLRVTHRSGRTDDAVADVAVGRTPLTTDPPVTPTDLERRPPVAAFDVAPQAPVAGQQVTLSSTSSDPDGTIAGTAWDLDGDGEFDDAAGPATARAFGEGTHLVGLRVVDSDGLAATAFATVVVGAAPGAPAPPAPAPAPAPAPKVLALLKPFPTVRIAGTAVGGRIQLRIFAVKAPRNTTVDVRCRGRGCPFTRDSHRVRGGTRIVRIRRLERRTLRAGIVIEVRVHAAGRVGKYTRLQMRAGAAPKRTDACVSGTRALKTVCPA